MKKDLQRNALAAFLGGSLFCTLYAINYTPLLRVCSFFFVLSLVIVYSLVLLKGPVVAAPIASLALIGNMLFYPGYTLLTFCSFLGIFLAMNVTLLLGGLSTLSPHRSHRLTRLMGTLLVAIAADVLVMCLWEFQTFPLHKALRIARRCLQYKGMMAIFCSAMYELGWQASVRTYRSLVSNRG